MPSCVRSHVVRAYVCVYICALFVVPVNVHACVSACLRVSVCECVLACVRSRVFAYLREVSPSLRECVYECLRTCIRVCVGMGVLAFKGFLRNFVSSPVRVCR